MKPSWVIYKREMKRYLKYLIFGPLIALVIYWLNIDEWRAGPGAGWGLLVALTFGVTIPGTIYMLYAAVFALLTVLVRGRRYQIPWYFFVGMNGLGMISGIWLARRFQELILGEPVVDNRFIPSILLGSLLALLFFFHLAYRQAREEALALRAAVAEARYHTLEEQMRPHFLFNALNSLAELIETGEEGAAEVSHKLSDLYRLILANSRLKTAKLASELEIVERYLEIEQLRFGARLTFRIAVPDDARELWVPSLVLQTLAENAVKHGVARSVEGGRIEIALGEAAGGWHLLSVSNTGAPLAERNGAGVGLENTRERLGLLYGDRHGFRIARDGDGRTVASFAFSGEKID